MKRLRCGGRSSRPTWLRIEPSPSRSTRHLPSKIHHPSAGANGGSAIWGDIAAPRENTRTDIDLFSPFSADRLIKAGADEQIIYATERVARENPHLQLLRRKNPRMADWYALGARIMAGECGRIEELRIPFKLRRSKSSTTRRQRHEETPRIFAKSPKSVRLTFDNSPP